MFLKKNCLFDQLKYKAIAKIKIVPKLKKIHEFFIGISPFFSDEILCFTLGAGTVRLISLYQRSFFSRRPLGGPGRRAGPSRGRCFFIIGRTAKNPGITTKMTKYEL